MPTGSARQLPRTHRWAGITALAAAILFIAGNALWGFEQPGPNAGGPELVGFYGDLSGRIVAGAFLSLVSLAFLVAFAGALRAVLVELDRDELPANVAFGGLLLGAAAGVGAETINMAAALRARNDELTEPLALALFDVSYVLGSYAAGLGLGLFTLAISAAALRTSALLPRWLATLGVALGVAMVTPLAAYVIGEYATAPAFLLLPVLGVLLLRGSGAKAVRSSGGAPAAVGLDQVG